MTRAAPEARQWGRVSNLEAEAAVIGAALLDNRIIDQLAAECGPEHFHDAFLSRLWGAILDTAAAGQSVSPATMRRHVIALGGKPGILARLIDSSAAMIGAVDHARQIRTLANLRAFGSRCEAALDQLHHPEGDHANALEQIDAALWDATRATDRDAPVSAGEAVAAAASRARSIREGDTVGIRTGLPTFDRLCGVMEPGQLVVIGGRPGMGKSALGQRIARGIAEQGGGTVIVTPEMTAAEIGLRMAADMTFEPGRGGVPFERIKRGDLRDVELAAIDAAQERAALLPLQILDSGRATIGRIGMAARRWQRTWADTTPLAAIVIDYLQLVRPDERTRDIYEAIGEVSRGLKQIAKECGIVVIALAQLSRAVEQREDKRPMLSDLRETGQIEQDADAVIFVYREEYYLRASEPEQHDTKRIAWEQHMEAAHGKMELIAAKVRAGRTGTGLVRWFGEFQAIREMGTV